MATTTTQEGRSAARSSLVVPALTLLLAVAALWRVRQGLDFTGDGAHMVSLAVRMAQGDVPFRDEMNVQALGSVTAVPFTWVWLQLHGTEGIVLASRIWYLVVAFTFGALCYRALRTGLPPVPAFVGVVLALTPTPYNLLVTSYNTMPTLALGLAVFSGYAALLTRSGRWGAVCGVALAFATLSHPASLPGAAMLGVIVLMLGLRRGVTRGLLAGGLGVSAVVVAWVLLVPGPSAVKHTLTYTTAYQSGRPTPVARLAEITDRFGTALWAWGMVPVALLVILALVPAVPARWRAAALLAVWPVMAVAVVIGNAGEPKKVWVGVICAAWAVMVVLVLVLPVSLAVLRTVKELRLLLLLSLPLAVVGGATYGLTTSADAQWGPTMPPMAALLGVIGMALVLLVRRTWSRAGAAVLAAAVLVSSLGLVHVQRSFRDPAPWQTDATMPTGPHAGLRTTSDRAQRMCEWQSVLTSWLGPGESMLAYQAPGAYLVRGGPMDTNIIWLGQFGPANQETVDWMERTGRWPDVVVAHPASAAVWKLGSGDPLTARLVADYGAPVETGSFLVLRRDGAKEPPWPAPEQSCME